MPPLENRSPRPQNTDEMRLAEAHRVLDLPADASEDQVKRAWRDLTKVWHPDRFAHDPSLQRKAEEKLKEINEAYETIMAGGGGPRAESRSGADLWRVRSGGREIVVRNLESVVELFDRGTIGDDAEVFHPSLGRWVALRNLPQLGAAVARLRLRRYLSYAIACAVVALVFLLRRPTPSGLVIAGMFFAGGFYFIVKMRQIAARLKKR